MSWQDVFDEDDHGFPYERQENGWRCGAAALCMVYRSFGIACVQAEVWRQVGRADRRGRMDSPTHLLARDALRHGLSAVIVQAADPWGMLTRCGAAGLRVIIHQRLRLGCMQRHFSVLVRIDDDAVLLHDPLYGAGRRVQRHYFLGLWSSSDEQPGDVLVAFTDRPPTPCVCAACGAGVPAAIPCPRCRDVLPLQPAAALGCVTPGCRERGWRLLFCPHCDLPLPELPSAEPERMDLAPEPAPNRAVRSIDPQLGAGLRRQLLDEFGDRPG
jgi:hypothetical protein